MKYFLTIKKNAMTFIVTLQQTPYMYLHTTAPNWSQCSSSKMPIWTEWTVAGLNFVLQFSTTFYKQVTQASYPIPNEREVKHFLPRQESFIHPKWHLLTCAPMIWVQYLSLSTIITLEPGKGPRTCNFPFYNLIHISHPCHQSAS